MESVLAGIALGVGVLGAGLSFAQGILVAGTVPAAERRRIMPALYLSITLTIVFFLVTLPKEPPFSAGQRLGWGFLIGAAAGWLAALAVALVGRADRIYWPYPGALAMSLSLVGVSLVLLLFRGDPGDALLGCAVGIVMVAWIVRLMVPSPATGADATSAHSYPVARALEAGAIVAVILAAACGLAVYHFNDSALRGWWAYPLALAALWIVAHIVAAAISAHRMVTRYPLASLLLAGALSAGLVLLVAGQLAGKLEPVESFELLLAGGVVTGALIAWLSLSVSAVQWSRALQAYALAAALIVVLVVLSFKLLAGFGAALALIAAAGTAGAAFGLKGSASRAPAQALAVGASFLLLRLFMEKAGGMVGEAELAVHYTLIGVVIGVLLPFVYSSFRLRWGVGNAVLLGALAAASPVALLALWGPDAALGLLAGLAGAQALSLILLPLAEIDPEVAAWHAPTGLLALIAGLVAVQFSQPFSALYEMPRLSKAYVAGGIALVVILWIVVMAALDFRRKRRAGAAQPSPAGPEA